MRGYDFAETRIRGNGSLSSRTTAGREKTFEASERSTTRSSGRSGKRRSPRLVNDRRKERGAHSVKNCVNFAPDLRGEHCLPEKISDVPSTQLGRADNDKRHTDAGAAYFKISRRSRRLVSTSCFASSWRSCASYVRGREEVHSPRNEAGYFITRGSCASHTCAMKTRSTYALFFFFFILFYLVISNFKVVLWARK